jgi:hypothetical protein
MCYILNLRTPAGWNMLAEGMQAQKCFFNLLYIFSDGDGNSIAVNQNTQTI